MKNRWKIIFLVLVWCGFSNNFGLPNIVLGAVIAIICCLLFQPKQDFVFKIRLWALLWLLGFIMVELIKSSLLVAWEVVTPSQKSQPKIIDIDLACRNDVERTVLANLISLTPGTLSIDLNKDKTQLKVHFMFAGEQSEAIDFIKNSLEPKVMGVFKYEGA